MVRLAEARAIARDWVRERSWSDLIGAFLTGSAAVGPGDRELAPNSDVDLILVTAGEASSKIGKRWHAMDGSGSGVLLDVSSLSVDDLDVESIAGTSYLAPFFTAEVIIDDPTGQLAALSEQVRPLVHQPAWVRRRVAEVRTKIIHGLDADDPTAPLAMQTLGWVFPASLPTVMLLVAAGRPPTVRTRYLRCRELLTSSTGAWEWLRRPGSSLRAPLELYERLLEVLGCRHATPEAVRHHLAALAETLRVTVAHARTPYPFSSDLRPGTWHLVLDGSTELVEAGWHREAVWYLLVTYARCLLVLAADAPHDLAAEHEQRLTAAVEELIGFRTGDGPRRGETLRAQLPVVDALAEALVLGNAE